MSVSKDDEVNGSTVLGIETVSHMQGFNGVFVINVVDHGVRRILHIICIGSKMVAIHHTNKNLIRSET